MHGSLERMQKLTDKADVHAQEADSGRTALHKAAFWGHLQVVTAPMCHSSSAMDHAFCAWPVACGPWVVSHGSQGGMTHGQKKGASLIAEHCPIKNHRKCVLK